MVEGKGGERLKRDLQFNHSIVEAQVGTGGGSEQGTRHKWELEAQVSKRRKWENFGGASEYFAECKQWKPWKNRCQP